MAKEQFLTSGFRSLEPCITKISDTSFMLGRDQTSFIVDETQPSLLTKSVLKWNEPLAGAGKYFFPFLIFSASIAIASITRRFHFIKRMHWMRISTNDSLISHSLSLSYFPFPSPSIQTSSSVDILYCILQ